VPGTSLFGGAAVAQTLSASQVKALTASAKTPAEHLKLAKHYEAVAARHEAEAREHDALAAEYSKNPTGHEQKHPMSGQTAEHCKGLRGALPQSRGSGPANGGGTHSHGQAGTRNRAAADLSIGIIGNPMAKRLYVITRDLHLYVGLFLSPFILLFAISVFFLLHGRSGREQAVQSAVISDLPAVDDLERLSGRDQVNGVRPLLDRLGVSGEINFIRRIPKDIGSSSRS
jgi:hypothetical protein